MKFRTLLTLFFVGLATASFASSYQLLSPNGELSIEVELDSEGVSYSVLSEGESLIAPSRVSMTLDNGEVIGAAGARVTKSRRSSMDQIVPSPIYIKEEVEQRYNELTLSFKGNYSIIFRAYDGGVAYRFALSRRGEVAVYGEQAEFNIDPDTELYICTPQNPKAPFMRQINTGYENIYVNSKLKDVDTMSLIYAPLYAQIADKRVLITESDLISYPGMYLSRGESGLTSKFAPCPVETAQGGYKNVQLVVKEYGDYIAKTSGSREFPWRVVIVAESDGAMLESDMVYLLSTPSKIKDTSWIKPGMVAWDWWCDFNLRGVDFKTGVNNDTYKYFIDFASEYGVEYVILDEGWNVPNLGDMLQIIPEIDLPEIVSYANERGVDIILWAGHYPIVRDMEGLVKHYAEMGIKGFKIDFLSRDDQTMADFVHELSRVCAENKMLLDFHGVSKPAGLNCTYPNVLNFEGVLGLEHVKMEKNRDLDMVTHDVTMPFVRMINGPIDYTQGAMINSNRNGFSPNWGEPMSQGTRARQAAMYVAFFSPMCMMCDSPSNYLAESEFTEYITSMPTVWDETVGLDSQIGERLVVARRLDDTWYVGAMVGWDGGEVEISFDFLGEGEYRAEILRDGINADRVPRDYKLESRSVKRGDKLTIECASGGGFAIKLILEGE